MRTDARHEVDCHGTAPSRVKCLPEIKHDRLLHNNLVHVVSFVAGILVILSTRLVFEG